MPGADPASVDSLRSRWASFQYRRDAAHGGAVRASKAIELMAAGATFDYDEAERLGLINGQIDAEDDASFLDAVLKQAAGYCPPHRAPMSVGLIKRAVQSGADLPLESGLALERELCGSSRRTTQESISAFVEKRRAHFKGPEHACGPRHARRTRGPRAGGRSRPEPGPGEVRVRVAASRSITWTSGCAEDAGGRDPDAPRPRLRRDRHGGRHRTWR